MSVLAFVLHQARARELERRRRVARAQSAKEQQHRYYVERNAAAEAKYEQKGIAHFQRAMADEARKLEGCTARLATSSSSGGGGPRGDSDSLSLLGRDGRTAGASWAKSGVLGSSCTAEGIEYNLRRSTSFT